MPRSTDDILPNLNFNSCPCGGRNLDKLVQPAILILLARESLHGYLLVQRLAEMPLFRGEKPDPTGIYRTLKLMEGRGVVTSTIDLTDAIPARRIFHLTDTGRACLARWTDTLATYRDAISELLTEAEAAVG